jgi:hypothetical protein
VTELRISHNRYYELLDGIENENLVWYVADRESGDVVLLFENSGDELLFLLRWS